MQGDSIVLKEEIDPNYTPTESEILEYAKWLGMDPEHDKKLFWIAREGLKAPLPDGWKPCKTTDTDEIYYFNFTSGESSSTSPHACGLAAGNAPPRFTSPLPLQERARGTTRATSTSADCLKRIASCSTLPRHRPTRPRARAAEGSPSSDLSLPPTAHQFCSDV